MYEKLVKDLMVALDNYSTVSEDATLFDALQELEASEVRLESRGEPPRAVLVLNQAGSVIGQFGHLDFLKALEPKYNLLGDLSVISRAGMSPHFIDSLIESFNSLHVSLIDLCHRSAQIEVKRIMRPLKESIEEDAPLTEAIHKMVIWQAKRTLVTRRGKVVGILRLVDIFTEVSELMKTNLVQGNTDT
ncbi:MAG: CBS domain-containing protein [Candidatus Hatepunaea meridiana]|nr:CBS domain-containing protein [Candidatus Hatepunaea meridiana]